MFFNLQKTINTKLFDYCVKNINKKSYVECSSDSPLIIVSQVCSRDLQMYLVAIKTFSKFIKPYKVILVADRLKDEEKFMLQKHIDNLEIIDTKNVDSAGFPVGGCWERLLTIIDISDQHYVIQLDSDTITTSNLVEVRRCITENRSFTLGTDMGQQVITFQETSDLINSKTIDSEHVQICAERSMGAFKNNKSLKYIRGCAGFAGFAKNEQTREKLKEIAKTFEAKIGKQKWAEWGSEQVASNIVVANSSNPLVLPINKYHYYKPGIDIDQYCFLHFIGDYRFVDSQYRNLAKKYLELISIL